jgi:hypothetical protein
MKRLIPKNWRAKLISVLFLRLTLENWRAKLISVLFLRLTLENWRAKLISFLVATMIWYLIKKKRSDDALAI